jgi:hypothetical protein
MGFLLFVGGEARAEGKRRPYRARMPAGSGTWRRS